MTIMWITQHGLYTSGISIDGESELVSESESESERETKPNQARHEETILHIIIKDVGTL